MKGSVVFRGPEAQEALIVFHPIQAEAIQAESVGHGRSFGQIQKDGSFVVSTYETGDGMPRGQFVATVTWRVPGPDDEPGMDVLAQTKYASPVSSPLRVVVDGKQKEFEPFLLD